MCGVVAKSCPTLVTPWSVACQAPLSMRFSKQGYWSGVPFLSPGDVSNPGIKPRFLPLQADSLPAEPQRKPSTSDVCNRLFLSSDPKFIC